MLDAGEADAIGWDHAIGISRSRDYLTTIPVRFDDPYAVWIANTDTDFRDEVDAALLAIINDGTWVALFTQWFGFDPPWTIEEMLAVPPIDR
jgi:ABC-type amino acid transport substrate-binding protein